MWIIYDWKSYIEKNISTSKLAEMVGVSKGNTSTWKKAEIRALKCYVKWPKPSTVL